MKTIKRTFSLFLVILMIFSMSMVSVNATEVVNSTGSVLGDIAPDKNGVIGIDNAQNVKSEYISVNNAGNQDVNVHVTKASTYTITIPKIVILSGNSDTAVGQYSVKITGDLSGTEYISVAPDAKFLLKQAGKTDIIATIIQEKTVWNYSNLKTDAEGTITATNLSAGSWSGNFRFNINRDDAKIGISVKDSLGNNLNATSVIISGEEKNNLLSQLQNDGFIESIDDVNVLLDVTIDDFTNSAISTFNVSSIASPNDKVTIYHFNNKWEKVTETIVNQHGDVTATFNSFSPIAFVVTKNNNAAVKHNGIIPIGATYTTANGDTYKAGENFPQEVNTGDIYTYGDYEYRYNMYKEIRGDWCEFSEWWYYCTIDDGWGMIYTGENKSRPNNPLWQINGKDVTCAIGTYLQHLEIEAAPVLPETLKNMAYTFSGCENLKEAPHIPASVIEIAHCFFDNYALIEPPVLSHCENLYTTEGMFWNCDKITTLPVLPNSVVEASSMFEDCSSIVDASDFVVPENIVDMYAMFAYCENLKYAPVIPEHVTSIWRTFRKCTALEDTIIINSNITKYTEAFEKVDMSKIIIAGSCDTTTKQAIANTGINGKNVTIIE